jgi:hypothetical protein
MARKGVGLSTGKKVKRVITQGRGGGLKRARRTENVDLSNKYGIRGANRVNVNKPGGLKGAVTQSVPKNKHALSKAKGKIK